MSAPTENTNTTPELALPPAVLDKYKAAGVIVQKALQHVASLIKVGANVLELTEEGDKIIEKEAAGVYNKVKGMSKGVAFPTSVSVNSILQNMSPIPTDPAAKENLQANDTVKILLGAQVDGYAVIGADTVIVPDGQTTPEQANLIAAAYNAAEVALRLAKPGKSNWDITEGIKNVLTHYEGVNGVEGVLSHQFSQNNIEATKGIVAFPTDEQRRAGENRYVLEEGEIYGLNIQLTSGEPKPKQDLSRTTIYQRTGNTYQLKLKTARATYAEITKKAGLFPFTLRSLDNEQRARLGVQECAQHNLLKSFDVTTTASPKDISAQVFVTFAIHKNGVTRLSPAPSAITKAVNTSSSVQLPEDLQTLIAQPLRPVKNKKK